MSSARSGTALTRSGKLRLIRAATTTGRSSVAGKGRSGASASSRRRARSPSRPAPVGGGCASSQATIRSGKSRRSSAGSKRSSRLDHGIRSGRLCVTFVVIIWSSMPVARRSPKVSGPPSSLPARSSIRSASQGVRAGVLLPSGERPEQRPKPFSPRAFGSPSPMRTPSATARPRSARTMPAITAQTASAPEPVQSARTASATPGANPAAAVRGKLRSAAAVTRSHLPAPFRPSPAARSRKYGRVRRSGWKRRNRLSPPPIHAGSSASFSNPPCSRPCSAAAAPAAAIAPADVPPTFANRYTRASSHSACG